jgi:hypothetical protein
MCNFVTQGIPILVVELWESLEQVRVLGYQGALP